MRDLYKRRKRLVDLIKRINDDVDEPEIEQKSLNSSNIGKIEKGAYESAYFFFGKSLLLGVK